MNYAVLDDNQIVIGVSQLIGQANSSKMVQIQNYDPGLIGKKWNGAQFADSEMVKPQQEIPLDAIKKKLDKLEIDIAGMSADLKAIKDKQK